MFQCAIGKRKICLKRKRERRIAFNPNTHRHTHKHLELNAAYAQNVFSYFTPNTIGVHYANEYKGILQTHTFATLTFPLMPTPTSPSITEKFSITSLVQHWTWTGASFSSLPLNHMDYDDKSDCCWNVLGSQYGFWTPVATAHRMKSGHLCNRISLSKSKFLHQLTLAAAVGYNGIYSW